MKAPTTAIDPIKRARECLKKGNYLVRPHAFERQQQHSMTMDDVQYVIERGFHEQEKTLFDVRFQNWKYAIRGKTLDGIDLRVIVSFPEEMVIITVINILKKKRKK